MYDFLRAILESITILSSLLTPALQNLGINSYTILILRFSEGSVKIDFELSISASEYFSASAPSSNDITIILKNVIENNQFFALNQNGNKMAELAPNSTFITGLDETDNIIVSECPTCWKISEGLCVPDEIHVEVVCNVKNEIRLVADKCVFENLDISELSLNGDCDATNGYVFETEDKIVAYSSLDGCSSTKIFSGNSIVFGNSLIGEAGQGNRGVWNDQYKIDFSCEYGADVGVSNSFQVESAVSFGFGNTGGIGNVENVGQFGFGIQLFTDDSFSENFDGPVKVGSTLYSVLKMLT